LRWSDEFWNGGLLERKFKKNLRKHFIRSIRRVRHFYTNIFTLGIITSAASVFAADGGAKKMVIAHRGASGYLPEHTLEAVAMAYAMGADYIEQDVVLTKDDRVIVLHDIHLEAVANVAQVLPQRARSDGRYYAIDFTLAEIKALQVNERIALPAGSAVYPKRFPVGWSRLEIPTLEEEIMLVQGLNKSTGREVGIYVELKAPAWHLREGKDLAKIVVEILERYGYRDQQAAAFIQCFDPATLKRLKFEMNVALPLVQLLGENNWNEAAVDYERMRTPAGLTEIAAYARGIGPWLHHLVLGKDKAGKLNISSLARDAHALGLLVHPYTFRADEFPDVFASFDEMLRTFFFEIQVDGVFTDFPDRAVKVLQESQ
jgi:glycerophosphoryl diester phosphodiesterase